MPLQIIIVKLLATKPEWIETYYSNGIYPVISKFFRLLLGWIPFSIGDIIYGLLVFFALRYIILNRRKIKAKPLAFLRNIVVVLSIAYFTFHLVWGMNYYRQPIHKTLKISEAHTDEALKNLIEKLIVKANAIHIEITNDSTKAVQIPYTKNEIFDRTIDGYNQLEKKYSFLEYKNPSLKKSLFSLPLTYSGYAGYLNPFTNEAQVNSKIPLFRFPVVAGHEVGHQIGYSAENETNFIGYLVTANNDDIYFKYAAYSYALSYCLSDIRYYDEELFRSYYNKLNVGVKMNYQELADFWNDYENPLEPAFKSIFSSFLKINNQADGIKSYSRVVSLLVTYHQEHPLE
mgnify:FL=1